MGSQTGGEGRSRGGGLQLKGVKQAFTSSFFCPLYRLVPHALSQIVMGRQTDGLPWIEQGEQHLPTRPHLFKQKPFPPPSPPALTLLAPTVVLGSVLRGSTLQPLRLTLNKLDTSPLCLISQLGDTPGTVLTICCTSPHPVTFCQHVL